MKLFYIYLVIGLVVSLLLGCATSSPIQRFSESESHFNKPPELLSHELAEKDIFRIYHRASTGFVSIQSIRQAAEERAENFAKRQGKTILVLGEKISSPPYILGNFPRIEIVFALIDETKDSESERVATRYEILEKLKELLNKEILTNEEFEVEKKKVLND